MGMIRDSFIIFKNWADAIEALPEEFQLETYKGLVKYGTTGDIPSDLSPIAKAMLISFSAGMESTIARYNASVNNGKLGGRPKKTETQENPEKPSETQNNQSEPTQNLNDNVNVNVNVIDNVNKENSLARVKESDDGSSLARTQKHKYGIYKNVLLTEAEYDRLISEENGSEAIDYFSEYKEMKGCKYKNDNLAIRKWVFTALKEQKLKEQRLNTSSLHKQKESPLEQLDRVLNGGS